jgi:hypothetical protein
MQPVFDGTPVAVLVFPHCTRARFLKERIMHATLGHMSFGLITFGRPSQTSSARLHCDHCRRELGARVHRYWRMRFCSPACVAAYQERLGDDTKAKIRRLEATDFEQARSSKAAAA